jgi:hypothetical protein
MHGFSVAKHIACQLLRISENCSTCYGLLLRKTLNSCTMQVLLGIFQSAFSLAKVTMQIPPTHARITPMLACLDLHNVKDLHIIFKGTVTHFL